MGNYEFTSDLANSHRTVNKFAALFTNTRWTVELAPDRYFPDWDVKVTSTDDNTFHTFELKDDFLANYTGNVAIEFSCRGKESGLAVTKAEYWVQYYHEAFHIVSVERLRKFLNEYCADIVIGGDHGSSTAMRLVPIYAFEKICESIIPSR